MRKPDSPAVTQHLDAMIRLKEVLRIFPISRSAWYAGQVEGRYPKGVAIGPRTRAYRMSEIQALIASAK